MGPPREPPSIWAKNVQLSVFALIIALITAFVKDHQAILTNGFFQGYSRLVVLVIALEAGGGLVVAAVIKYADNILKSFATSVSIVTSTIVSAWVFGFTISRLFVGGCVLVFVSSVMYARDDEVINTDSSRIQYMPVVQANVDDSVDSDEEDNKNEEGMVEIAMTERVV
jgi:UDP-sugar transporter A1/2/3